MIHLTTYKIFETLDQDIIHDVRDICQELSDIGFEIRMYSSGFDTRKDIVTLIVKRENKYIKWEDIKEYPLRVKDYLGNRYISFEYGMVSGLTPSYHEIKLDDELELLPINSFKINFHGVLYDEHLTNKIFESLTKEEQTIKEICYDLPNDFILHFSNSEKKRKTNEIIIYKYPNPTRSITVFYFNEVKETLLRIKDFLGDKFILYNIYGSSSFYNSKSHIIRNNFEDLKIKYLIYKITLKFYK